MYNNTCFLTFCNGKNTCNDVRVAFVIYLFLILFHLSFFPFLLFNFSSPSLLFFLIFPFFLTSSKKCLLPPFSGASLFLHLRPTLTKLTNSCEGHPISLLLSLPLCNLYTHSSYLLRSIMLFYSIFIYFK